MNAPADQAAAQPQQITVTVQYVKDFSLENPNAPTIFAPTANQPVMNMGVNVQTRGLAENTYEVLLMLHLDAKIDDKVALITELTYGGVFVIPPMPEEQLKFFLMAEGPRYLFPFARSVIANAVRDAGFPQILINPIDFAALYQANAQNIQNGAAQTAQ